MSYIRLSSKNQPIPMLCGGEGASNTGANRYVPVSGKSGYQSAGSASIERMPCAGIFSNLTVKIPTAPDTGKSYTFALYTGGAASALTVTISNLETTGEDNTHSVKVAKDDYVMIEIVPSGTPDAHTGSEIGLLFRRTG